MAERQPGEKRDVYRPSFFTTVIGTLLGLFTVGAMILAMLWVGRPAAPPAPANDLPAPRTREQVEQQDAERLGSYGWVDRERGIVRIPIEQAMERLIAEQDQPAPPQEAEQPQ